MESVEPAGEDDLDKLFEDCQRLAVPPFGNLYGLRTVMDDSIEDDEFVVFRACTQNDAVRLRLADYERLAEPTIVPITR